ncbi:uncharacterized protein N0V89_005273 [Didymosphaeria variabile]|uniref:Threonine/serine exporter-like N-terminal domain-containing protein n=1 Tax=Didymosphaeria variabile TaxID=1932322 RepID=A0A9W9CBK8_9PLEO|nr:uncharacterized protein N0V89_005273 [Didymosphaeria variabile]KAJ4353543.1 hypothetical protein N0V89_005273 [Didymosphaeria variabile]
MSSDGYKQEPWPAPSHEMEEFPHDSLSVSPPQGTERRRVRINSSAAEIPGGSPSYSRVNDLEAQHSGSSGSLQPVDDTTAEVNGLWQAHRNGGNLDSSEYPSAGTTTQPDDEDVYTYSGNTQGGVFYHLLQAYKTPTAAANYSSAEYSPPRLPESVSRPGSSGGATPRKKWYEQEKKANHSQETLATLIGAAAELANPKMESKLNHRPQHKRNSSNPLISKIFKAKEEQDAKIKIHVASILKRQQYIIKMCRALMIVGAPTHRLEEYLAMTAKVLEVNSQFLYIPGCMIISFDDTLTHTAEVKIVRTAQGVNLGKLKDCHEIYKEVLHDVISLDDALAALDELINRPDQHPVWLNVIMYGLASVAVSGFFKARWIDMGPIFIMGTVLGFLQLVVAPLSKTYNTVFEISAAILMTCISRALGSIRGGNLFCFSALTQSSIAMILPGWLVLSSSLELQSRAIVPGSIRLIYAIIYSLFLGYGITVGTALYGAMDSNATNATTCQAPLNSYWNFMLVPLYVLFACHTVQAKYKQMPVMIAIAFSGYIVNFYANMKFSSSAPIAYTFGAFAVGVLANLYSRLRHGVAAAVLLPAVYVQVPGSLAASGAITTALQTAGSLIQGGETDPNSSNSLNAISFNVAAQMIQIAIGITVGLFMSALLVYPLGKKRSGLWTL